MNTPKRKRRAGKIIGAVCGVLVLIVALTGVGYLVFHDSPTFCNAVCHNPMDKYVENYYEGNDMARIHMEANVLCVDCHEPEFSQQIEEGVLWLTGDFQNNPDMMTDFDNDACLKCHISEEFQAAKTDALKLNPHADAHQKLQCTDCHRSHREQVNYCNTCHSNQGQRMITWPLNGHTFSAVADDEPEELQEAA